MNRKRGWSSRSRLDAIHSFPLRASDYLDEWNVNEDDEEVGLFQLFIAFLTLVLVLAAILGGAVVVAAWMNVLP